MKYLIDSNILITSFNSYYAFDIAPGFWQQLLSKGGKNIVFCKPILSEINKREDELSQWVNDHINYFDEVDDRTRIVGKNLTKIMDSVVSNDQYNDSAKEEFGQVADSRLCAIAKAHDMVIVTQESFRPNIKRRVKIPNICREFDIRYCNIFQLMRDLNIVL